MWYLIVSIPNLCNLTYFVRASCSKMGALHPKLSLNLQKYFIHGAAHDALEPFDKRLAETALSKKTKSCFSSSGIKFHFEIVKTILAILYILFATLDMCYNLVEEDALLPYQFLSLLIYINKMGALY